MPKPFAIARALIDAPHGAVYLALPRGREVPVIEARSSLLRSLARGLAESAAGRLVLAAVPELSGGRLGATEPAALAALCLAAGASPEDLVDRFEMTLSGSRASTAS